MFRFLRLPAAASALVLAGVACKNKQDIATDVQLTHMEEMRAYRGAHWDDMVDNAILHDMSIADLHFVPHSTELSGTGVARLDRMAPLLDAYGGTVRYETQLAKEELIQSRLQHVREYLTVTGCNMDRVELLVARPGGRGIPANWAIEAVEKSQSKPKTQQAPAPGMSGLMQGGSGR